MTRRLPVLAMLAVLLLVAGGAYAYGRATAPDPAPADAACSDARTAAEEALPYGDAAADTEQGREDAILAFTIIVQNPGCFDATTRAQAQTALDAAKQQQDQDTDSSLIDRMREEDLVNCAGAESDIERRLYC